MMAIDMSTENSSLTASPRISFSHDLSSTIEEDNQFRLDSSLLEDMDSDEFNFSISNIMEAETTSAEDLFSHGLIRPLQIQEKYVHSSTSKPFSHQPHTPSLPPLPLGHTATNAKDPMLGMASNDSEQKNQSKSFWSIKRSNSLHVENGHKKSSFWSLPLLSRSNSTGSVPKESQKHNNYSKLPKNSSGLSQKPPLRKNYGGPNANGMRISPVLNMPVPSSTISKGTANLLGLGSLFRSNGREKKIKK